MRRVTALARAFAFLFIMAACAPCALAQGAGPSFINDMREGITALYCVDENGAGSELSGPLTSGANVEFTAEQFEPCARLGVISDKGAAWQFVTGHNTHNIVRLRLAVDESSDDAPHTSPSLLVSRGAQSFFLPAGISLHSVLDAMRRGMDRHMWERLASFEQAGAPEEDVLILGGVSWSMTEDGLGYRQTKDGRWLAASLSVMSPFSAGMLTRLVRDLLDEGMQPSLFEADGKKSAFTEAGAAHDADAVMLDMPRDGEAGFEALTSLLDAASKKGLPVRVFFHGEGLFVKLDLNLDTNLALLSIELDQKSP